MNKQVSTSISHISLCLVFMTMTFNAGYSFAQISDVAKSDANVADATQFLPSTTAILVHVAKPGDLIETIETHPVVKHVLELKQIKKLMRTPQFSMFQLGKGLLESKLEETVIEALKANLANGLWFAVDAETGGLVVLFQAKEEDRLKRVAGQILKFASSTGNASFKKQDYRGAAAAEFDNDVLIARYKSWFAITNKSELVKKIVDNMNDGADSSLADQDWFQQAVKQRGESDVWAAVDMETLRAKVDKKELFRGRTDNPAVELVFGGILDSLKHSPIAWGELNIDEQINVSLSAPFKADWADDARDYFFGTDLSGRAPIAIKPKNMIASLTSFRDVGEWWLSKEELYAENVIAQLAQADSQLSTIFSGMDFGEDVLGALEPGVQIVVAENTFDDDYVPDVKLPAFALIGKLKDPNKLTRKLKIAFQSVVGFANINLGMNGQPQLEVETETIGRSKLVTSEYYYEDGTEEGLILFNFAPSIAFKDSHIIISSTRDFAVELAKLVGEEPVENSGRRDESSNTKLSLDGPMVHKILSDNIESLIAQNMLEEGNERSEAESQLEIVLLFVDLFKRVLLDYDVSKEEMSLDLSVLFRDMESHQEESTKTQD